MAKKIITPWPFTAVDAHEPFLGVAVPDIITFIVSPLYLNRPNLYPRQATLLKIIFCRLDLLTDYDHAVIDEWEDAYRATKNNGIVPGIRERMAWLYINDYDWFREVLLVMGRRAGKGHISGLALAYVLWSYMRNPDPQGFYGVDRDKKLNLMVFAGKREQAKAQVWQDVVNVITGSVCFAKYVHRMLGESLTIWAPNDFLRIRDLAAKGITNDQDQATFVIVPKESTLMAGRGPTSFAQAYDEMAHVVASGANRSAEEVYQAATPALDQFGKHAFIIEPSSPWQMLGQFYENYQQVLEIDPMTGDPAYPEKMMIQLTSWDIYKDWERAPEIPLFPEEFLGDLGEYETNDHPTFVPLRGAIQSYDEGMVKLEKASPDTFKVERRSHFAAALDAYLNEGKVKAIFGPWDGRLSGPVHLTPQESGLLAITYKGHGDPSKVNDKFGIAVAHAEADAEGRLHCVFDLLHHFNPGDFDDGIIDYEYVDTWIWDNIIKKFHPDEFTFDQYNSGPSIQRIAKKIRAAGLPKRVDVFEKTTTAASDWEAKEQSKVAINLGLVHAPATIYGDSYERAELELRFLQLLNGKKVDHPSAGPVQSKDIADSMMECIHMLIGEQVQGFMRSDMSNFPVGGASLGDPFPSMSKSDEQETLDALRGFGRARGGREDVFSYQRGRRDRPRR